MQGVRKTFANGLLALDGITLTLPGEPQFLAVLGASGCGKSTMLRIAANLDTPSAGRIDGPAFDRAGERGGSLNLGYVFQEPTLMPWATVFDNVRLPLRIRGQSGSAVSDRVMDMLGRVGLRDFARTDSNLRDVFKLYGASKWQTMLRLRLPSALPYYLAGLRISGGLALIGAVVAESVAGTGGTESGLAYRILESAYRLRIPRVFVCFGVQ